MGREQGPGRPECQPHSAEMHTPFLPLLPLVPPDSTVVNMEAVLQEATALLQSKFGFVSCTIQVERYLDDMTICPQCQDPRD